MLRIKLHNFQTHNTAKAKLEVNKVENFKVDLKINFICTLIK